jgi:hypothetical protein
LPGYGFAKTSKTQQQEWGDLIGDYLRSGRPKHLFLLIDIRHEPSPEDRQMFQWTLYSGVPFTLLQPRRIRFQSPSASLPANKAAKLLERRRLQSHFRRRKKSAARRC